MMKRTIAKLILKRIYRWKIVGKLPHEVKKFVLIGAPHTSSHDFFIGLSFKWLLKGPLNFVGKRALFDSPLGFFFKWFGGIPIDRTKSNNFVSAVVSESEKHEYFRIAISPEGTRKKVTLWKTGFYYIAKEANIPIVMLTFDFGQKQLKISEPYYTTNDKDSDFNYFHKFYEGVVGKNPK